MIEALVGRLAAAPSIAALVGREVTAGGRNPLAVAGLDLTDITQGISYTHEGRESLSRAIVQFDCYGASWPAAKALGRAVIALMEQGGVAGGREFLHSPVVGARALERFDLPGGGRVWRWSIDIAVWSR